VVGGGWWVVGGGWGVVGGIGGDITFISYGYMSIQKSKGKILSIIGPRATEYFAADAVFRD
jgi:hypothetical protein